MHCQEPNACIDYMSDLKQVRHVQIRLGADEFETLKRVAGSRQGATQEFSREAILKAIAHPQIKPSGYAGKWHDMLGDILDSGDKEAIEAIQYNLRVFHRVRKTATAPPKLVKK
jgi:hypothetical protein